MALAPKSTARRASSPVCTPLMTMGPFQASRIQRKSVHETLDCSKAAATSAYGIGPCPGSTTLGNFIKPPSARKPASHPGRDSIWPTKGSIDQGFQLRSSFTPLRTSRYRRPETGVSMVTTSAAKPAARARAIVPKATSRPPRR